MNRLSKTAHEIARRNKLLKLLMDDLVELLEEPGDKDDSTWILAVIDGILENLSAQFDLVEQEGYMSEVLERYPNWHPQVEHLQQEHQLLNRQLRETGDRLEEQAESEIITREMCRQLIDWIESYRAHEHRENLLILDAFTLDVGEGE